MKHNRIRGVLASRADSNVAAVLAELNTAFADFRTRNDTRIEDVVRMVEAQQGELSALRIGGDATSPGIHPGAGIRGNGRRFSPLQGEAAEQFRAAILSAAPQAGMTTQSDPDGGFTVGREVDGVIEAVMRDLSPMRSLARVVSIGQGRGHWEKIIGRSGAQTAWAGEEETRSDTASPILGKIEIYPHEIYAVPELTNHVIEDSEFDLNAFLEEDVSGEFALGEGSAFISGTGIKQPRGFLTFDTATDDDSARAFGTLQYLPTGSSGAFPGTDPGDILFDLVKTLRPTYRRGDGVAWLMNSTTANVVRKFKDGNGRYLWSDSLTVGQPDRLLGYPVSLDEGMPDIGADAFAIAFGNWRRGYAIIDKTGTKIIVDRLTKKGWTKVYFSRRVGGGLVDSNAIKLLKFSAS